MKKNNNGIWGDDFDDEISSLLVNAFHGQANELDKIGDTVENILEKVFPESASNIINDLEKKTPNLIKLLQRDKMNFEKELNITWGKSLNLLEMFLHISIESGYSANKNMRNKITIENHFLIDSLTRLYGRACQVCGEIICLLRNGLASGANARWRTLHEISVVMLLISEHGNNLAERFLSHNAVQVYQTALEYQKYAEHLEGLPYSDEEIEEMKDQYQKACGKYGNSFSTQYGWASLALGKQKPTFKDLEQAANIDHLRPYYKLSCDSIHVTARGIINNIDLLPDRELILVGPSNSGLADPGQNTALSLYQINASLLLSLGPSYSNLLILKTMDQLLNNIVDAFNIANDLVEKSEK